MEIETNEIGTELLVQRQDLERIGGIGYLTVSPTCQEPPKQLKIGFLVIDEQNAGAGQIVPGIGSPRAAEDGPFDRRFLDTVHRLASPAPTVTWRS